MSGKTSERKKLAKTKESEKDGGKDKSKCMKEQMKDILKVNEMKGREWGKRRDKINLKKDRK